MRASPPHPRRPIPHLVATSACARACLHRARLAAAPSPCLVPICVCAICLHPLRAHVPLPLAVRRGSGRVGRHTRAWPPSPPLQVRTIKLHQQYEAPAAVVATVHRLWRPTFDVMATPLSAVCGDYATLEDDVPTCRGPAQQRCLRQPGCMLPRRGRGLMAEYRVVEIVSDMIVHSARLHVMSIL